MLTREVFQRFRDVAYRHAGITLKDGKETLVEARIAKRIAALGLADAQAYLSFLERDADGEELVRFLDVISTNFTSFFREVDHFTFLTEEAEQWLSEGRTRVRVWCAASSTGEEPYSLAMTLDQVLGDRVEWKLLATDISTRVLAQASAGVYPADRLAQIPAHVRNRYFQKHPEGGPDAWLVRPALREHVVFGRLNLSRPPYPLHGPLDAVFCRNVMIYFDTAVRQHVADEVERLLRPGAPFVVGHAETLAGVRTSLRVLRPSVFRKAP